MEVILRKSGFSALLKILKYVCEVQPGARNLPGTPPFDNVRGSDDNTVRINCKSFH